MRCFHLLLYGYDNEKEFRNIRISSVLLIHGVLGEYAEFSTISESGVT
jgi:hypothetical protein